MSDEKAQADPYHVRTIDVIIPARNEVETLGPIIDAFHQTINIGKVIVVDDKSDDMTWAVATQFGAMCISGPGEGKGQAVKVGLELVTTRTVVLCDADLTWFTVDQADKLMYKANKDEMVIGVPNFTPSVPWAHKAWKEWVNGESTRWGDVSGQRQVPTSLIRDLDLHGYAMEVQINAAAARAGLPVRYTEMYTVKQRIKPKSYDQRIADYQRDLEWLKEKGV